MSHPEAGDPNNYPTNITLPDDGDTHDVSSVNVALEGLADRTAWLKANRVEPGALVRTMAPVLPPPLVAVEDRSKSVAFIPDSRVWNGATNEDAYTFGSGRLLVTKFNSDYSAGTTSFGFLWCINGHLVDGATLNSVVARVKASAAHTALPATQMSLGVFRTPAVTNATPTSLRSAGDFVTDAQASEAAYEAAHDITATLDQNNVIDKSAYNYWIQFWDEFGADSEVNNELYGFTLNMTTAAIGVP